MAPKKLEFLKNGGQEQTADEEEGSYSSDGEEERGKPKSGGENGSTCSKKKKKATGKIFPDEDVIALLKGLALFWSNNGRCNDWAGFHNFIKDDLTNHYTKLQVSEKIRSLKKKFDKARGADFGDFSDSSESAVFELSKKLWGDENEKSRKRKQELDEDWEEDGEIGKQDFPSAFPLVYAEFERMGFSEYVKNVPWEKARELEDMWIELNADILRLELRKLELLKRERK